MKRGYGCLIIALATLTAALGRAQQGGGKPTLEQRLDALFQVRNFREVALAPNGRWLAWVEEVPSRQAAGPRLPAVFVADLQAPPWAARRLTAGDGKSDVAEHDLAWSPDSRKLAFLSGFGLAGQLQLVVADPESGTVKKLTSANGHLARPTYAPTGTQIAVLYTENSTRATGPTQAAAPEVGVIGEKTVEQRLSLVDAASGQVRPLSPPDLYVYEYDWSPDGKQLAAIAAPGDGDNNWYIARLITLGTASGGVQTLLQPAMQICVPRWSPDGQSIAFIGGLMSDEGANGGDIYTISAHGGPPRNRTPGLKASTSWLAWQPSSQELLFTAYVRDGCGIFGLDLAHDKVRELWTGAETLQSVGNPLGLSLSHDGKTMAMVRQSFDRPPEIWSGTLSDWQQRTHENASQKRAWGLVKSVHWQSDGRTIQGWLLYPENYDPGKRYPMVVSIHGGPASVRRPTWPGTGFDFSFLSGEGYFVFFPNPRGSFGQGEQFTRANVKDFGHGDLRDTLAGVDQVVHTLPVDDSRLGVVGWSYGGYMTMWTVTQTNRFRAAVAGAGIANWQSYYGENGIDQWLIPYFGASVYDDPAVYARCSPMNFIKNVKTPTLVLVGESDLECPAPQSFEFWRALQRLHVPTQLVVYAGEGHAIRLPDHRRDILRRSANWLGRALRP